MLLQANALRGFKLDSLDGEIGKVSEFYFDDQHWAIRYLVADTGGWLSGRQVLISPYALVGAIKEDGAIVVNLTRLQIQESPSLNSDKPVSRQFEVDYHSYYGWPMYWGGPLMWGAYPYLVRDPNQWNTPTEIEHSWDPHLRSTDAVTGHHIQATDGGIGHVVDFIIDDETWAIRYLVVDTRNWWPGKKVLVSPEWIERVSWTESKVFVKLSREAIKASPEYSEESLITRDYESGLFRHYERDGYWSHEKELITSE
ncbi:MAG: photosystem reaction center subunit H [Verrucomicrobia bacterium 12-59-8]|nr:MAG: photosystem reaction center subunit H [Verrucomicrobia bacterium 12-59-8]